MIRARRLFPDRTNCEADCRASICTSFLFQEYGFCDFPLSDPSPITSTSQHSILHTDNCCMRADWWELNDEAYQDGLHPHDDPCLMPILYLRYEIVYPASHPYLSIYLSPPSHLSQWRSSLLIAWSISEWHRIKFVCTHGPRAAMQLVTYVKYGS
jgi:hypothetical protein